MLVPHKLVFNELKLRNTCTQQLPSGASVSGPYQGRDLYNFRFGRLSVAINRGVLSVNAFVHRRIATLMLLPGHLPLKNNKHRCN